MIERGPAPAGGAWLVVAPGTADERRVDVGAAPLVIGSDAACDVQIADPHVSRRHAEVRRTDAGVVLRDLGSRNGTYVERVAIKEATLAHGARIDVGTTTLAFETDGAPGPVRLAAAGIDDAELAAVPPRFGPAVGASPAMRRIFALLAKLAPTELTITLTGETGTGKDVLARAIHGASPRAAAPLVVFDCGAVSPTLIETELFGHERGAFTGAVGERRGAFERAHGGTLFLDEIGELLLDLQPKLLRALEQRKVRRVGGAEDLPVDVRIVAATNRDLEEQVRLGRFREDLFFRLSAAQVVVPPLRARREDLPALVGHVLEELGKPMQVARETLEILGSYEWPGNVRELKNVVAGAAAVADGPTLEPRHLILFRPRRKEEAGVDELPLAGRSLETIERAAIEQTLRQVGGHRSKAARALGIAPSTLYEKIKKYGLVSKGD
jgi:DNA-binding NtrC family response regulator